MMTACWLCSRMFNDSQSQQSRGTFVREGWWCTTCKYSCQAFRFSMVEDVSSSLHRFKVDWSVILCNLSSWFLKVKQWTVFAYWDCVCLRDRPHWTQRRICSRCETGAVSGWVVTHWSHMFCCLDLEWIEWTINRNKSNDFSILCGIFVWSVYHSPTTTSLKDLQW